MKKPFLYMTVELFKDFSTAIFKSFKTKHKWLEVLFDEKLFYRIILIALRCPASTWIMIMTQLMGNMTVIHCMRIKTRKRPEAKKNPSVTMSPAALTLSAFGTAATAG